MAELLVEGVPEHLGEGGEVDAAGPGVHHQVHEPHQHVRVVHLGEGGCAGIQRSWWDMPG